MSYSFNDFFYDKIQPELKKLDLTVSDADDCFLDILKEAFKDTQVKDSFIRLMVQAMVNPDEEDMSAEQMTKKLFDIMEENSSRLLRKIEFSDGNTVIKVNYNGLEEEKDS